jgi:Na+/proline symporter
MSELWKKLTIFHLSFNFKDPNIFILAILNGVFGSLASFSTDYEVMQKLLTLSTRKQSQKSILYTIIASSILVVIYLLCGTLIYYYLKFNSISYSENPDKIISYFTVNFIPSPFKGLVFLTVLLASIDLPLVSLSTSFVNDVFLKFKKIEESNMILFTRKVMIVLACF